MTREDAVELLELFRRTDQTELPPVSPLVLAQAYIKIVDSLSEKDSATEVLPTSAARPRKAQKVS